MAEGGSLTGTKSRHSPRDMLIDEKRFWSANASRLRSSLRKDPELGVNKCSGSDRISESLLQRDRNGHGQVVIVQSSRIQDPGRVQGVHEAWRAAPRVFGVYGTIALLACCRTAFLSYTSHSRPYVLHVL